MRGMEKMPDKRNTELVRTRIRDLLLKLEDTIPPDTHICNDGEYNLTFLDLLRYVTIDKYRGVISYK